MRFKFSKVDLLIKAFIKGRLEKFIDLFVVFLSNTGFMIIAILNIIKYTSPRKIKNILTNILKILTFYREISSSYMIVNLIFLPFQFILLFLLTESRFSPLRAKLTYLDFKKYVSCLSN